MVDYPACHSLGFGRCTSNYATSINIHAPIPTWEVNLPTWVFPKIWVPQNGWFIMENPIKMDDWGVYLFLETSTCKCSTSPTNHSTSPNYGGRQPAPVGEAFPPHSVTFEHRFRGGLGSPNEGMEEFGRGTGGGYSPRKTTNEFVPLKRPTI